MDDGGHAARNVVRHSVTHFYPERLSRGEGGHLFSLLKA